MASSSKNIVDGIRELSVQTPEIKSGTVVARSLDEAACTVSIMPTGSGSPIQGITLNTMTNSNMGLVLYPEDGSNVVFGSIDGPGQWTLLKAGTLAKATINIGPVSVYIDNTQVQVSNGSTFLNVGSDAVKLNTSTESLYQLLKDCFTYLTELTVTTSTGASSVPVNVSDFTSLLTRINNLLSA